MSGLGRKHASKWVSKQDTHHHHPSVDVNSGSHYRDKVAKPVLFNTESNASRRSSAARVKHSSQARSRSRVSQNNDNSYYSEQDETRQQFSHRSDSRSRSRSRSPVYRARRDHAGSYDRNKTRTRDISPLPSREFNKRGGGDQSSTDYGWEDKARKPRETRYHSNDVREEAAMMIKKVARSSDYDDDNTEERSTRKHVRHDGVSDPRLRRHRSEFTGEKETQRRDDGEGRFRRSSEIHCKFFAAGNCRNGQLCRFTHHRGQSSKFRVDDDQRSSGMYSYSDNKPMADSHQSYNNVVNTAPVQAFNNNALPYQNSLSAEGTQHQVIAPASEDNHHSIVENSVPVQSGVNREQIDQISNISATIAQLLANGQSIPQLTQALQIPLLSESSVAVQPNQTTQSNNNPLGMMSTDTDEVPPVTTSQVSNVDEIQELPVNPKTDEASKEGDCKKTGEDAENVVDDEDDGSDEEEEEDKKEKEKEKDTKGMRTFKFALVETVKELLKPAWKEGKMKKDGYKNIVKKVVEKVTGSMQSGNVPTTQEKVDQYLSASKPKLTKLVQAYISKVKKT